MTDKASRFRKLSRPLKITIQVGVLIVILSGVAGVGFIEYSAQPSFCNKCHNMRPYYESWATSSHNDVPCIECHYAPGIRAEAMGKFQAANQVVKYVTGAYGTKPWAEIEDAACLRSGCHSLRKVEGVVNYRPTPNGPAVQFDHTQHLGELRLGKQLRCTSCHSQIVQGAHLAVTPQTCNLCHFKGAEDREASATCVACHQEPARTVSPAGFVVDHPQYVRDLVDCRSCHEQVVDGSGNADEDRCWTCHNEPARIEEFQNTTLVHRVHIADHNVECAQCHTPIEHRLVALGMSAELNCAACHQRVHDDQQRLYAGLGGHGTESQPSSMFLARVSCQSCHQLPKDIAGHESVQFAGEASCMSCHGTKYANILPSWQQEMERRTGKVESVVRAVRRAAGSASVRVRGQVDSLVARAEENVAFVRRGKGAHNIAYADQLLRASLDMAREAVSVGKLPYRVPNVDLGPSISENACLQCHLGVERQAVDFRGRRFDHARHTEGAGLSCARCHSSLDDHGKTLLTKTADCASCHHPQIGQLNCAACHEGKGGAPAAPVDHPVGAFPHGPHMEAGFTCANCHEAPSMSASNVDCTSCHAVHHQPNASCVSCHQSGAKEKHALAFAHTTCSQCHGEKAQGITKWTRQVCTTCHVDLVEHNAPVDCVMCHEIAPIGAGGAGG